MAQVIKGAFPAHAKPQQKKEQNEPVPSYLLHISITFSDPLIWRRIQVPGQFTLARLHRVIQAAMGWQDEHTHQFLVGKISFLPAHGGGNVREAKRLDERNYELYTLEEGMKFMFSYIYDAGDGWEHIIHLEEVIPPSRPLQHPILLSGENACPPETVGDVHAYTRLVTDFEKGDAAARNELCELSGWPDFNPLEFDLEAARKKVAQLS